MNVRTVWPTSTAIAFTALPAISLMAWLVNEMNVFVLDVARPRIFFNAFKSLVLKLTTIVTPLPLFNDADDALSVNESAPTALPFPTDCNVIDGVVSVDTRTVSENTSVSV